MKVVYAWNEKQLNNPSVYGVLSKEFDIAHAYIFVQDEGDVHVNKDNKTV